MTMGKEHQQVFGIKELYRSTQEPEVESAVPTDLPHVNESG